ncbi:MAG: Ribosomal protein L11 methyltransferase [Chlamydiia bacterium]|nr:Ribosomal protein L11 methyltransferase [Chlamydiia bacterium]
MKHAQFQIFTTYEDALHELTSLGMEHPYSIEEQEGLLIGGFFETVPTRDLQNSILISAQDEIDWDEQLTFSPYYKEGVVEIDLADFSSTNDGNLLKLVAGPGFGDLSHPTTQLMLESLPDVVESKNVIDIGCGNGILTLASLLLGAKTAYGIDIEDEALEHAEKNAKLNDLPPKLFRKSLNISELDDSVYLINMTLHEQIEVYKSLKPLNINGLILVSGLLKDQKESFLDHFLTSNYTLIEEREKMGWISLLIQA